MFGAASIVVIVILLKLAAHAEVAVLMGVKLVVILIRNAVSNGVHINIVRKLEGTVVNLVVQGANLIAIALPTTATLMPVRARNSLQPPHPHPPPPLHV